MKLLVPVLSLCVVSKTNGSVGTTTATATAFLLRSTVGRRTKNSCVSAGAGGHDDDNNKTIISQNQHCCLLIVGLGRVGQEVARQAMAETSLVSMRFGRIFGTIRPQSILPTSSTDHGTLAVRDINNINDEDVIPDDDNVERIVFDATTVGPVLKHVTHVLITIPPPVEVPQHGVAAASEDTSTASVNMQHPLTAMWDIMEHTLPPSCWIGLLSTTGVYGNHDGEWVTEESSPSILLEHESRVIGKQDTAFRYLLYEHEWQDRAKKGGHLLRIFRCAGIYGPESSALHTIFREGYNPPKSISPVTSAINDVTNRIHISDLARAVLACMRLDKRLHSITIQELEPVRLYNLADNTPESRSVVMKYAYELLIGIGISVIPRDFQGRRNSIDAATTKPSPDRSTRRRTDCKRVCNRRMRDELLDVTGLLFPTYKEGLQSILKDQRCPWWQA